MELRDMRQQFPAPQYAPVLITEVTRMRQGALCVAGWSIHDERMVRPLPGRACWHISLTGKLPCLPGQLLHCPWGRAPVPPPGKPHGNEDRMLRAEPRVLAEYPRAELYGLLLPTVHASVRAVFGRELCENRYVPDGTDCPSLGGLRVPRGCVRFTARNGHLRLEFRDADGAEFDLPVTDQELCRLYEPSAEESGMSTSLIEANEWLERFSADTDLVLRMGLARGWAGNSGEWKPPRCFAQVNGVICPG